MTGRANRIYIEIDDASDRATDAMFNALHAGLTASEYRAEADGPHVVHAVRPAVCLGSLELEPFPNTLFRSGYVYRAVRTALRNAGYDVA